MSEFEYRFRYQDGEAVPVADVLSGKVTPWLDDEVPTLVTRLSEDDEWEPVDDLLASLESTDSEAGR